MHGEYKVPGGKLVVVDVEVADGRLTDFRLAGDFFLEPDSALEDINAAVNGLPAESDATVIADAVRAALPAGAQLLGFTPEAVGTAVRRALVTAPGWRDFDWEIVHEKAVSPRMNLALDEVLTSRVGEGRRRPTLRIWEWEESAVVIGSFQSYRNEVDTEGAAKHGFDVVRRISGGGAMLMAAGQIITYSLYVPASLVQGLTFADSYAFLDDWVLQALRSVGVDATYQPLNDIASPTGKIGGAAQKRLANGGVLHHATISYDIDGQVMTEVLRIGKEKLSDKG
ncbi:MAG: lipoate--protein ligase family protein, partial [Microbacterium sp.]